MNALAMAFDTPPVDRRADWRKRYEATVSEQTRVESFARSRTLAAWQYEREQIADHPEPDAGYEF